MSLSRYNPAQPVGEEGPVATTGKVRWVEAVDLPRFEQGVVAADQVARPPLGWTSNHALARCWLRTPRPFLKGARVSPDVCVAPTGPGGLGERSGDLDGYTNVGCLVFAEEPAWGCPFSWVSYSVDRHLFL